MDIKENLDKAKDVVAGVVDKSTDVVTDAAGKVFGKDGKVHKVVADLGDKLDDLVDGKDKK